jgi:hypothetical protein
MSCYTAEKMSAMVGLVPYLLGFLIIASALVKAARAKKTVPSADKKNDVLRAMKNNPGKTSGSGIGHILMIIYALYLSNKKNNGLTASGVASAVVFPEIYVLLMLLGSFQSKFSFDRLLGKGTWKKCMYTTLPVWYWFFLFLVVGPAIAFALFTNAVLG